MFLEFTDKYIYINDDIIERSKLIDETKGVKNIYEVFRVISGYPLFVDDHFNRLEKSLKKSGIDYSHKTVDELKQQVKELCKLNNKYFGNVELRVIVSESNLVTRFLGFIPHYYPEPVHYIEGVKLSIIEAERKNPNVKAKFTNTRLKANAYLQKTGLYEVLLVNNNEQLTEGSKSNLFFIKDKEIYTAPDELVLCGITRLNVIRLLKRMHYKIIYKAIKFKELDKFDAAFICGTSPGVLPVSTIESTNFNVSNAILQNIIIHYNDQISNYISS